MGIAAAQDAIIPYDDDFAAWAEQQAAFVLSGVWSHMDRENVSEEIAALAVTDKREIRSRLTVLLEHAIKLHEIPDHEAGNKWNATIREQRRAIFDVLFASPSLLRHVADEVGTAFARARADVLEDWNLPKIDLSEEEARQFVARCIAQSADESIESAKAGKVKRHIDLLESLARLVLEDIHAPCGAPHAPQRDSEIARTDSLSQDRH